MRPFNRLHLQSGMSLIEMIVAMGISSLLVLAGTQFWTYYQKTSMFLKADHNAKEDQNDLGLLIKKVWDIRQRDGTPGIPNTGVLLQTKLGGVCTSNCPVLKIFVKRTLAGAVITDEVSFRNECLNITGTPQAAKISALNFASPTIVNTNCGACLNAQLPIVVVTGKKFGTTENTLSTENKQFPDSTADLQNLSMLNPLGMQACFSQANAGAPLSLDLRVISRNKQETGLRIFQKTQVLALENFANIKLEQAP